MLKLILILFPLNLFAVTFTTPTRLATESLVFKDDLDFAWMEMALERQIQAFQKDKLNGTIKLGETIYPRKSLLSSVVLFKSLVAEAQNCIYQHLPLRPGCFEDFSAKVNKHFDIYEPNILPTDPESSRPRPAFFTAYYSPDFIGSFNKTEKYKYAIYALPKEESLRKLTRTEIDFDGKLEDKGYALFYVENLFDLYLMHVEGGGRVTVVDSHGIQNSFYLSFAGTNSQKFQFISKYMIEKGMLTAENATTMAQRNYIQTHPEEAREIFSSCPSYIYFKITDHPPFGVNNIPLTDNRSMATDNKLYKQKGLISYVVSTHPIYENETMGSTAFSRFFIDQDTGGAIKGKARADLYFGFGPEAEVVANNMKDFGEMYFLIEKLSSNP